MTKAILKREHFADLFAELRSEGFTVVGPTVRDGAIVYDEIDGPERLPVGWTEVQEAGKYRLVRRNDEALFGYAVGPHSWKKYFLAPRQRLFSARRDGAGFAVESEAPLTRKLALLGARACELRAIAVQDEVILEGPFVDPHYAAARSGAFVIAVNCGQAGGTCFCVSMGSGPRVASGHDLALTELIGPGRHQFLVEVGSDAGARVLSRIRHEPATAGHEGEAEDVVRKTAASMGRALDTAGIRDLLMGNLDHPRWDDVAERCLACANCTMVCPTCFCTTVEDVTDLRGERAERVRSWDSCFTLGHSYLHGGSVRASVRSRYRQWLTHKLATWIDQFGTSGCVGCGRCITWCPVGIDITEEVRAIRASPRPSPAAG